MTSTMLAVCTLGVSTYFQRKKEERAEELKKADERAKAEELALKQKENAKDINFNKCPVEYIRHNFPRLSCIIDSGVYSVEYQFYVNGFYTITFNEEMLNAAGFTLENAIKSRAVCANIEELIETNTTMQKAYDEFTKTKKL